MKVKDLSDVGNTEELAIGDEILLNLQKQEEAICFAYAEVESTITYVVRECEGGTCISRERKLTGSTNQFLRIDFSSDTYEAKNMLDFLLSYGKLRYIDSQDETHELEIQNPIGESYGGKTIFLLVPAEVSEAKNVYLELVVRDKHYLYKII